jgi:hypothetical protein
MDDEEKPMGPRTKRFYYSWNCSPAIREPEAQTLLYIKQVNAKTLKIKKHNNQAIDRQLTMAVKRYVPQLLLPNGFLFPVFAVIIFCDGIDSLVLA